MVASPPQTGSDAVTEEEWLSCSDPTPMLEFLKGKASDRKLRLFAVACCHLVCHLMPDERCRSAFEIAEHFADGKATQQELQAVADAAFDSADDNSFATGHQPFALGQGIYAAARAASYAAQRDAYVAADGAARTIYLAVVGAAGDPDVNLSARTAASYAVKQLRRKLLLDIFNPYRPVAVDPSWLTWSGGTVVKLAQVVYDERAFDRLLELAKCLEDAGCRDPQLLGHCRNSAPHVRGCWAVDSLLGKA
jgi:hypothetical protein